MRHDGSCRCQNNGRQRRGDCDVARCFGKAEAFKQNDKHRHDDRAAANTEKASGNAADQSASRKCENQYAVLCEKLSHAGSPKPNPRMREALAKLCDHIFDARTRATKNRRNLRALFNGQPDACHFKIND